jgi:hypothetical protein
MVTRTEYATVVAHFLEELSNVLLGGNHLAHHPDVRDRLAELSAEWSDPVVADDERLRAAAALVRLAVEAQGDALVEESYADYVRTAEAGAGATAGSAAGGGAPAL